MANTVTSLSYANTFGQWLTATGNLIVENNNLAKGDYTKDTGTLYLSETTKSSLQANGNAVVHGQLLVQGSGSSATIQNNLQVDQQVYFTNTTLGLVNSGQANIGGLLFALGSGIGLNVANNAYVGGNTTIHFNTITDKVQSNTSINTATLSVTGTSYTNTLQANTSANTRTLSVTGTAFIDIVQANTSVNTSSASIVGTTYTNLLQANTGANTTTLSVTETTYTNLLQANTGANTTTLSVTGTTYTDKLQANTSANTRTLSVTGTTYTDKLQANTSANIGILSVTGTTYTDLLQANTGANTRTLSVTGTTYTDKLQANTSVNTTNVSVTTDVYTNQLFANSKIGISNQDVYINSTDAHLPNVVASSIQVNGQFTISGQTVYTSNNLTLAQGVASNQNGFLNINRPNSTANASIRWNENNKYWDVLDVNAGGTYSKILTANLISDSVSSTSQSTIASSKAANTLNDSIVTANTSMKAYVDAANTSMKAYVDAANTSLKAYTDATIISANTSMKAYVDAANTSLKAYTDAANTSLKAYTDATIISANTSLKTYGDNTFYAKSGGTISGDVTVTGNLIINGTTTTVNTTTVATTDSLIKLANLNTVSDSLDIGFYGTYAVGGQPRYAGLVRQAGSNFFLFKGLTSDPSSNVLTSGSLTTSNTATLQANITGGTVSGLSANIAIADGGTNNNNFSNGQRIYYDGSKLASLANVSQTITGGLSSGNTITSITFDTRSGGVTAYTGGAIAITSGQVSGLATSATTDTSNATNITTGTLSSTRLPASGVTAKTYGGSANTFTIAVDGYGRITSITNTAISIDGSSISGTIAGSQLSVDNVNLLSGYFGNVYTPTYTTGDINAEGNITSLYSSDKKFKENVREIPNALQIVDAIGGKLFEWTDDYLESHGGEHEYFRPKSDFGVIAQDVEPVFPVAVRSRSDGSLAVDYEKLCALAFQAIKELKAEVDVLKNK